jgi:hypothetical protein
MKRLLSNFSRRWGYDGWALRIRGSLCVMEWSTCTTRREVRELRKEIEADLFPAQLDIVKVKIGVSAVP